MGRIVFGTIVRAWTSRLRSWVLASISSNNGNSHNNTSSHPTEPQQLINQGVSFLSGLATTLKSPEATKQLIDNIVEVDEKTGETNIKIPVASKETVMQIFSLFGKLFG